MQIKELLEKVHGNIKDSAGEVAERVIKSLTEREVQSRTDAFMTVLGKLEESRRAEKKIKPDNETYTVTNGLPDAPILTYSKAKVEELKKNQVEQKKLEEALNKALEGDFAKVKELAGKGGAKPAETDG